MSSHKNLEKKYQKMDQHKHILELPDTYIGSVNKSDLELWTYHDNKMDERVISITPGLYKIFDEILVNAIDQYTRSKEKNFTYPVTQIKVEIDKDSGIITVFNNGEGIPIQKHPEHNIYIPELIFGNLLTSENYDKTEEKIVGGRNGYGAKLTNIYSIEFIVETVDSITSKKYVQRFYDNMYKKEEPKITASKATPYTKITFKPDLKKFGMDKLDDDIMSLFEKRIYDASACTGKEVGVWYNGTKIETKHFEGYVDLFLGKKSETERVYEDVGARWEVAVSVSPDNEFKHISFVNGVYTFKGGKHVDFVANHIARKLQNYLANRGRNKIQLKQEHIKKNMWVFLRCNIVNPKFDSQTKEFLTTDSKDFGSKFEVSDKFIEKLAKIGIVEKTQALTEFKENTKVSKISGKKTAKITGIAKLEDAKDAGTKNSQDCILILTEGDSAKALAVAGISVVGNQKFGVFPLRGKLLNVREVPTSKVVENEEIKCLIKILGLEIGKKYKDVSELRYGKIMLFTDQDLDGAHIKGLVINFIETYWPELVSTEFKDNFIIGFITPLVVAKNGTNKQVFYSMQDYKVFRENNNLANWAIKYYKGLGTSNAEEGKEYFRNFQNTFVKYFATETSKDTLALAFDKKKADDRKNWLSKHNPDDILEPNQRDVSYDEFVHKDLKHFSEYDCVRSIPSLCDGLKPSQRKVQYGVIKRNMKKEIKVAQLGSYIAEQTSYHHGEESLHETIIGLAQDFVGSNNINLLSPNGQFGTRLMGGKDSASSRYIFTEPTKISKILFDERDDALYNYLDDDGTSIEPEWYLPVIPMVLVNGAAGIGTGYSTDIPCFNPIDIVDNLILLMEGQEMKEMIPWYRGFRGKIEYDAETNGVKTVGLYNKINDTTVEITELPIGKWTTPYTEFLEKSMQAEKTTKSGKVVKTKLQIADYDKTSSESKVHFTIKFPKDTLSSYENDWDSFEKDMHLSKTISMRNMHLYNKDNVITKYDSPLEIIKEYYGLRLEYYGKRKTYLLSKLKKELDMIRAKIQFVEDFNAGKIIIKKKQKKDIIAQLEKLQYPKFAAKIVKSIDDDDEEDVENEQYNYEYLLRMPIHSLGEDTINKLKKQRDIKEAEYDVLDKKTDKDLWKEDLTEFLKQYKKDLEEYNQKLDGTNESKTKKKIVIKKAVKSV